MSTAATPWPLQAAKDRFSQLVKAAADGPQTVTVHGKPAAIVLSPQAYAKLKRAPRGGRHLFFLEIGRTGRILVAIASRCDC